jgi:hypothetical protein
LQNLDKAVLYTNDPPLKAIFEIMNKYSSTDWTGLDRIVDKLTVNYKPSPIVSSRFVVYYLPPLTSIEASLNIVDKGFASNKDPMLLSKKACILIHQEKFKEASKAISKLRPLDLEAYIRCLILNSFLSGDHIPKMDSLKSIHSEDKIFSYYIKLYSGELLTERERQIGIDSLINEYLGWYSIELLNFLWQKGNKDLANEVAGKIDTELSNNISYCRFYESIGWWAYHIPFDIDAMPNFKQRLLEAGINPEFFKPMPQFNLLK